MSWTNELYKIYENNYGKQDEKNALLPIFHSTVNAQIEVLLSEQGEFISAFRIEDKADAVTIIPVTEDSGTRTSGIFPHPFADKLIYVAGDYKNYVEGKKNVQDFYEAYIKQLQEWNLSKEVHPAVHIVYQYLSKGLLMKDLITCGAIETNQSTGFLKEDENINGIKQEDAFVRFRISYSDAEQREQRTWLDTSLYECFIKFYTDKLENRQLCYATGEVQPVSYKHSSKIRNAADKAKLISANDDSGFSYRGRFRNKEEAFSIGYEYSQKIHNALKWLIAKQGISIDSMTLVAWESNLDPLPDFLHSSLEADVKNKTGVMSANEDEWDNFETWKANSFGDTLPIYKEQLKKTIWGNKSKIDVKSKAMIMVLDAATTGRLAMTMYSEMPLSDLYYNIEKWHYDCAWIRCNKKRKRKELCSFSLYEIVKYAFGIEQDKRIECKPEVQKQAILRLIPCVTERQNIPKDIIQNLVAKASNPLAYEDSYIWEQVLETACGMIRKSTIEKKGEYAVTLDKENRNRDYLYGRLLAVAEAVETSVYYANKDKLRTTNAARYFESFSNKPYRTWGILYNKLIPYFNQLPIQIRTYYQKILGEIMELFKENDYQNNSKLQPEFLLAYHCQLSDIYSFKTENKEEN